MSMRALNFGPAPGPTASTTDRLDYCVKALIQIQAWTNENSAATIARGFAVASPTDNRILDVSSATLAQTRQVLGTLLQDLDRRGAKRTS